MSLSIPKEQKHSVETPVMLPFYQYVKLSPVGSVSTYTLQNDNYSDEIKWELSGDNIINLAKSYIQYDIICDKATPIAANTGWPDAKSILAGATIYPNKIGGIKESFGLASFRICNQTGTDLVRLDDSYELYRIWMDEIVRKKPDQYYQDNYYDGITLKWDNNLHEKRIMDENEWEVPPKRGAGGKIEYVLSNDDLWKVKQSAAEKFILHVKIPLGRFYNTIMYIIIKFQTLSKFGKLKLYGIMHYYR